MTNHEIIEMLDRAVSVIQDIRSKSDPQMNVLDLAGVSHLELKNSDIIAYLLSPRDEHKCPRFGELFLERVGRDLGGSLKGRAVRWVRREQSTNDGRRIDILVETDQGEHIIIENKVGAEDSSDQLKDYIAWAQETYNAPPFTLYLSPSGEPPSEASLPASQREDLKRSQLFLCISYADHILGWLADALEEKQVTDHDLLRSALLQYKDAVEGFCGTREEDTMEQMAIVSDLMSRYRPEDADVESIGVLQDAAAGLQRAIDHIAIIHFLNDVRSQLMELGQHPVVLTIHQRRYDDPDRWLKDSLVEPDCLGVELVMDKGESELFGIGLEFSEATRNASVYFGTMAHKNGRKAKVPSVVMPKKLMKDIGDYSTDACEWWWQHASPTSWFNQALFRFGNEAAWQNESQSLSRHVVDNWIVPLTIR